MPKASMTCTFELGTTVGDTPTVDVALSGRTLPCSLGGFEFAVRFPETRGNVGSYQRSDGPRTGMFCSSFEVSVEKELLSLKEITDELQEAFDVAVQVGSLVTDTIWVHQPTRGFAGGRPKLRSCALIVNGESVPVDFWQYRGRPMIVGWPEPTQSDIEAALSTGTGPSVSEMLLAQASNYVMANPAASKAAGVSLAAIACEVSIRERLTQCASGEYAGLLSVLMPENRPSKLTMAEVLKQVFPLVVGRSLPEEDEDLYRRYLLLTRARNTFVHHGHELAESIAWSHVNTARELLEWIGTL